AHILLVEDNEDAAGALGELLAIWGHEVDIANEGPTALEKARRRPPDVVLLDIGLPGMDGYEVAKALRAEPGLERIRLIALTGYGQETDRRRSSLAGFDHHLVKPVDVDHLRRLLSCSSEKPSCSAAAPIGQVLCRFSWRHFHQQGETDESVRGEPELPSERRPAARGFRTVRKRLVLHH